MKTIHAKSPCCNEKVIHFGGRRRKCSKCKRTWRIRKKRVGRKEIRVHPEIEKTVIERGESLRRKAIRTGKGRELVRRRHQKNLEGLLKKLSPPEVPKGRLIAVADAFVTSTDGKRHTVYLILLRAVRGCKATVVEPLVLEGYETELGWRKAFNRLSEENRKGISGLVSDGFRYLKVLARKSGWKYQRCHFHVLKTLQQLGGIRTRKMEHKRVRERMYQLVKKILLEKDERKANVLCQELTVLSRSPNLSRWFGLRIRGFLREVDDFRTYITYPDLNLPATTNSAESAINLMSETVHKTRGFKTEKSLSLWLKVRAKSMGKIKCNGGRKQPN